MIKDILSPHRAQLSDHTELRAQKNTSRGVSMLGGNLVGNARTEKSGINARVYKNGVYGFASSAEYSEESIKKRAQGRERQRRVSEFESQPRGEDNKTDSRRNKSDERRHK